MDEQRLVGSDTLETPERVDLRVDLAGPGSRGLALLLDGALLLAVMLGTLLLVLIAGVVMRSWALIAWLGFSFLAYWFYFAVFEVLWQGQTPGKRVMGLRVQKVGGFPIGWPEALIRNFLKPLVDLPAGLPVGLLVMLFHPRHQRIGDLAAGTVVMREMRIEAAELSELAFAPTASQGGPRVGGPELEVAEFELLQEFLSRRGRLEPASRARIEGRLAGLLRERLTARGQISERLQGLGDEAFLVRLDAEYRG